MKPTVVAIAFAVVTTATTKTTKAAATFGQKHKIAI